MPTPAALPVVFYQRRPHKFGNFSLEFVFGDVPRRLKDKISLKVVVAPFLSLGLLRRLLIILAARYHQRHAIMHVTGDIHFACLMLKKNRTILTIADCIFLERYPSGLKHHLLKLLWLTWPLRRVRFVTTISDFSRQQIIKHCGRDPGNIVVIPVAIDTAFQSVPKPFNAANPRILQIGTKPNKNLSRLIEAVSGLTCVLVIIGKLPTMLQQQLRAHGIIYENHVSLTSAAIRQQYYDCDLVAFVSTYEGFGMPILEAQAVGRAVITSQICSMPEVSGDGACLVDPYDVESIRAGVTKVINDQAYRQQLIDRGFENCKRFDPEEIAHQYLKLYHQIAQESSRC